MATSTSSWLSTHDYATVAVVAVFDGIPYAYTSSNDTAGLTTAWNSATSGLWPTVRGGLALQGSIGADLRFFDARVSPNQLTLTILDSDDALASLLFAEARATTITTDLGKSIGTTDTLWDTVQGASGFNGLSEAYVGLEGFVPASGIDFAHTISDSDSNQTQGNVLIGITTRGYRSLGSTTSGAANTYAQAHAVDPTTGDRPTITSSPTKMYNRQIGLYLCHKKPDGTWSAGFPGTSSNDAELLFMGRLKRWTEDGQGFVSLDCEGILGRLQSTFGVGPSRFTGTLAPGMYLSATPLQVGGSADLAYTVHVQSTDFASGTVTDYPTVTGSLGSSGVYDAWALANAFNAAMGTVFWTSPGTNGPSGLGVVILPGTPSSSDPTDPSPIRYEIIATSQSTPASTRLNVALTLSENAWKVFGFTNMIPAPSTGDLAPKELDFEWIPFLATNGTTEIWAPSPPLRFNVSPDVLYVQNCTGTFFAQPTIPAGIGQISTGFTIGFISIAVPGSSTPVILCVEGLFVVSPGVVQITVNGDVTGLFSKNGTLALGGDQKSINEFTGTQDVVIQQAWIEQKTVGQLLLQMMLSTGTVGYNATYDVLPSWLGLAIPASFVNITSFAAMKASIYHTLLVPTFDSVKLFTSMLNAFGYQIVFANGQITAVNTNAGATGQTLVALTESNKAKAVKRGGENVTERTTCERNPGGIINRVTLRYNATADGSFQDTITVNSSTSQTDYAQVFGATVDGYGIYDNISSLPSGAVALWQTTVAATALAYFSKPIGVITRSYDFSLVTSLYPGVKVTVTDSALIDPTTGTRGVSGLLGWVVSAQFDWATGVGKVQVVFQPSRSDRFVYWAPSAQVDSTYAASGYTAGYNASTKTLKLIDHTYSLTTEGLDVSNFAVGEHVNIVELSPANPLSPLSATDIISAVDTSGGFATLTTGFGAFDSSKKYALEYDTIANDTSNQKALHAFIASQTSNSTGLAANDAYRWGGDPDPIDPTLTLNITTRYKRPNYLAPTQGKPLSVHKFADISDFVNQALVWHLAPTLINQVLQIGLSSATYTTIYGPIFIPLYFGSSKRLDIRFLGSTTDLTTQMNVRFVTSVGLPTNTRGLGFTNPSYVDLGTAATNWTALSVSSTSSVWSTGVIPTPASFSTSGITGCWFSIDAQVISTTKGTGTLTSVFVAEKSEF